MPTKPKPHQCRHLFTDGRQCGSPSLRSENFCYYHHTTRVPAPEPSYNQRAYGSFILPMPENRAAIQHALGEVLRRVAGSQIADRTANLLIYGLSVASNNLPRPTQADVVAIPDTEPVRDIVIDPEGGLMAPTDEPLQEGQRLTTPGQLKREEIADNERYVNEIMDLAESSKRPPKPPAPPNTPELERLLKLYPPPPSFACQPPIRSTEQNNPPPPPQPWQSASPTQVSI